MGISLIVFASFTRLMAYIIEVCAFFYHWKITHNNSKRIGVAFSTFFLFAGLVSLSQVFFSLSGYLGGVDWMFRVGQITVAIFPFLASIHLIRLVKEVEDLK